MKIEQEKVDKLKQKLPDWAIKQHPTKSNLSVIHPMAVIDRLNEVFGVGGWKFTTEYISCDPAIQKTRTGDRAVFISAVKGKLFIPEYDIEIEQYGGSTNDDKGDALKGGGTDALTKISSYLGIGAEIYKGKGNITGGDETPPKIDSAKAFELAKKDIENSTMIEELNQVGVRIAKSQSLDAEQKESLAFMANEKTLELKKVETINLD